MKRFFVSISCLVLVVCLCFGSVLFVSAADMEVNGRTVVNYMDYIKGYDITVANEGWALLVFDEDMFTSSRYDDYHGFAQSTSGSRVWNVTLPASTATNAYVLCNIPGGNVNNTFLDVTNIPFGSYLQVLATADIEGLSSYQSELEIYMSTSIAYYDENFQYITEHFSESSYFPFDEDVRFTQLVEMVIEPPENAKYCFISPSCSFNIGRTNDHGLVNIEFQFSQPSLKISTTYTQIIIEGIVNANPPSGYGTIIDLDELESLLNGQTQNGFDEADQIFNDSSSLIASHFSGFLFLSAVLERFIAVGWMRGILTVSLSLGILGFAANIAMNISRNINMSHGSKKGGKT